MKQVLVFQQYTVKEDQQLNPKPLKYRKMSKVLVVMILRTVLRFTLNREESYVIVSDRRELYSRLFTIVYDCAKLDRGLSSPRSTAMHYDQI